MVKAKKSKPASQEDVQAVKADVKAVRSDLAEFEKRIDSKFERAIGKITKIILSRMEVLLENRAADYLGVSGEEVKLMKDKQGEHEERITTVEQKIGLRA